MLLAFAVACRSPDTTKPEPATTTTTGSTPSTESLDTTPSSSGSGGSSSSITGGTGSATTSGGPWDGHYTGAFSAHIAGVDSSGATVADESCPGTLDLTVAQSGSPMIRGSFDCDLYDGSTTKTTPVSLRGDLASGDYTASGEIVLGESGGGITPISDTTWNGSFLVEDTGGAQPSFSATFTDGWAVKGTTFELDGTMTGTRDP